MRRTKYPDPQGKSDGQFPPGTVLTDDSTKEKAAQPTTLEEYLAKNYDERGVKKIQFADMTYTELRKYWGLGR